MSRKKVKFNLQTACCGVTILESNRTGDGGPCDKPATAYCKTCEHFLCESCLKPHRRLVAIGNHILLNRDHEINPYHLNFFDKDAQHSEKFEHSFQALLENLEDAKSKVHDESLDAYEEYRSRVLKLLLPDDTGDEEDVPLKPSFSFTEPCAVHPDMNIMFFCETHVQLCCDLCKHEEHSTCSSNLKFIPKELPCITMCQGSLSNLTKQISTFKEQDLNFQCDLKQLKKSKETSLHDLKNLKRKVLDWINLMEVRAIRRLDIAYDKGRKEVEERRKRAKECIEKLRAETYFLTEIIRNDTHDDVYRFIKSKKADELVKGTSTYIDRQHTNTRFSIKLNTDFEQVKHEINHLYELHFEVKGEDKFNVRLKDDMYKCNVTGCAVLPNDDFVLADRANSKVKRFDKYMKPLANIVINDGVFDLTYMDPNRVAMTTPVSNKIKIVGLKPEMTILNEFQMGNGTCWGISYHNDVFAVNVSTNDSSYIRVIDTESQIISEIKTKCNFYSGIRNIPNRRSSEIVVVTSFVEGEDTQLIHYIDEHEIVQAQEETCSIVRLCEYNFLNHLRTRGLELDRHGNPVVCCKDTDQVYTIYRTGTEAELLLAESDGVCRPQSLCYNVTKDLLLVTSENTDFIQIFKFEI